jgi:hypothetical protein
VALVLIRLKLAFRRHSVDADRATRMVTVGLALVATALAVPRRRARRYRARSAEATPLSTRPVPHSGDAAPFGAGYNWS